MTTVATIENPTDSPTTESPAGVSATWAAPRSGESVRSGLSARGVLRSEWTKLVSVRSNLTTLAAAATLLLVVGLVFAAIVGGVISDPGGEAAEAAADPTGATLQGTLLAQLVIGVLGVLVVTGEYATGMIRTTLTAVPKRLPVLAAKAAVVVAAVAPVMLVASFGAFFTGQALIGSGDIATDSLGDPGVARAVVGTAGYLTGVALMGLAAGTLLRSTAAAISTLFGVVFLLPGLGQLILPASWRDDVLQYLPSNAADAFRTVEPAPELLGTSAGLAVFAAWVVVPLVAAAVALRRRSA